MIANQNAAPVTELGRKYQTRDGADSAALRLAIQGSSSALARRVMFSDFAYQSQEGGPAYECYPLVEGWGVRQIPAAELAGRVQAGLRQEIDRLLAEADKSTARAKQLSGTSFSARHVRDSIEYRDRARTLEELTTVALVRRAG